MGVNLSAFTDDDFDGVDDAHDKCLDTPFTDLVDSEGCTSSSLVSHHQVDVIVGIAYSQKNETTLEDEQTLYSSLQLDYSYKELNFYLLVSRYQNSYGSGLDDTYIGGSYTFSISDMLNFSPSLNLALPTYDSGLDNEQVDISAGFELSYFYKSFAFSGAYLYTFINDTDTQGIEYQNTSAYQLGATYSFNEKVYVNTGIYKSTSMYRGVEDIESFLVDLNYYINNTYFILLNYSHGLSESASDNYVSLKFGYHF